VAVITEEKIRILQNKRENTGNWMVQYSENQGYG